MGSFYYRRILSRRLAGDPRVAIAIALIFSAIGLVLALDPTTLHDEGLLTYGSARALAVEPLAALFFQKARPALSLFYLPITALGVGGFLVVHVLVAAAAIPLMAATARALEIKTANIAALAVACSPLFFWSAPSGLSNSDGVTGLALALFLVTTRRPPLLTGAVLGALPWFRYELAPFVALLIVHTLVTRPSKHFVVGVALFPVGYLVGGALYHHDALWALHFPPALSQPMESNEEWLNAFRRHSLDSLSTSLLGVTPFVVLLPFVRVGQLDWLERLGLLVVVVFLALFAWTHLVLVRAAQLWVLGFSPRYALQALPLVALLVARATDHVLGETRRGEVIALTAVVAALLAARSRGAPEVALWLAVAVGLAITLKRAGSELAVVPLLVGGLAAPFAIAGKLAGEGYARASYLPAIAARLDGRPVLTNVPLLGPYLARTGAAGHTTFLLAADHLYELQVLTNPRNGQREKLLRAFPRSVFGDTRDPTTLTPASVPATVFVLRDDARNELILPRAVWQPALHEIVRRDRLVIAEVR